MLSSRRRQAKAMWRMRRRAWVLAFAVLVLAAAGCGSGGSSADAPVRLDADPAAAAAVAPVHVSISGLPAAGLVTVQARTTDDQGRPWESAAVFRASDAGTLNLATAVPVSGSYHTADAAGLLWSLHPAFTASPDTAFATSRGFTIRLQVLTGGHVRATRPCSASCRSRPAPRQYARTASPPRCIPRPRSGPALPPSSCSADTPAVRTFPSPWGSR